MNSNSNIIARNKITEISTNKPIDSLGAHILFFKREIPIKRYKSDGRSINIEPYNPNKNIPVSASGDWSFRILTQTII